MRSGVKVSTLVRFSALVQVTVFWPSNQQLFSYDADTFVGALQSWQNSIDEASSLSAQLVRTIDSTPTETADSLTTVYELAEQLRAIPVRGAVGEKASSNYKLDFKLGEAPSDLLSKQLTF